MPLCDHLVVVHRVGAFQDAGQCVVVLGRDGIEFVIVATGTAKRHAHEGAAKRVELLIDDVHLHLASVIFGQHLGADTQESGGDVARVPCRFGFVAGRF